MPVAIGNQKLGAEEGKLFELADLTVITLTYARQELVASTISYWGRLKVTVLIFDESATSMDKQSFIQTPNITDERTPVSYFRRIAIASSRVSTKFVACISDDELFLPGEPS